MNTADTVLHELIVLPAGFGRSQPKHAYFGPHADHAGAMTKNIQVPNLSEMIKRVDISERFEIWNLDVSVRALSLSYVSDWSSENV